MPNQPIEFDYACLPDEQQHIVKDHTEAIGRHMAGTTLAMIDIGRRLTVVRELVGPKLFAPWLRCEFEWSVRRAYVYMQAAEIMGDLDCLEKFVPHAVQELSKPSTPAKAREEAIELARAGTRINTVVLNQLLLKHRPAGSEQSSDDSSKPRQPVPNLLEVLGSLRADLPRLVGELTDTEREELAETLVIAASKIYQFTESESPDCVLA